MKRFVSFGEIDREPPDAASATKLGYGKGYTIGFFVLFSIVVASFVNLFRKVDANSDDIVTLQAVGLVLISFGGAFALGLVYTVATNKGIAWSVSTWNVSTPDTIKSGTFERGKSPLGFWSSIAVIFLLSLVLIVCGLYCRVNPLFVRTWFLSHFGTGTGAS